MLNKGSVRTTLTCLQGGNVFWPKQRSDLPCFGRWYDICSQGIESHWYKVGRKNFLFNLRIQHARASASRHPLHVVYLLKNRCEIIVCLGAAEILFAGQKNALWTIQPKNLILWALRFPGTQSDSLLLLNAFKNNKNQSTWRKKVSKGLISELFLSVYQTSFGQIQWHAI